MENEALGLLERDSSNNRRYTFAELMMRAKGYPGNNIFNATVRRHVALHARWLHGDPDESGAITYKPGFCWWWCCCCGFVLCGGVVVVVLALLL